MSQGRIQEPLGRGTSSSAAVPLDTAESPDDEVFRTSQKRKSARSMRRSTAGVIGQSRSWTPAAYELEESSSEEEEEEDPDTWVDEDGRGWWRLDTALGRWYLVGSNKTIFWDEPD